MQTRYNNSCKENEINNNNTISNSFINSDLNSNREKIRSNLDLNYEKFGEKEYIFLKTNDNLKENSFDNLRTKIKLDNKNSTAKFKELAENAFVNSEAEKNEICSTIKANDLFNDINLFKDKKDSMVNNKNNNVYNLHNNHNSKISTKNDNNKYNSEKEDNKSNIKVICNVNNNKNNVIVSKSKSNIFNEPDNRNIINNLMLTLKTDTESSYENLDKEFMKNDIFVCVQQNLINENKDNNSNNKKISNIDDENNFSNYNIREDKNFQVELHCDDFIFRNKELQIKDFNKENLSYYRKKNNRNDIIKTIFPKTANLDSSRENLDFINYNNNSSSKSFEYLTLQKRNSNHSKSIKSNNSNINNNNNNVNNFKISSIKINSNKKSYDNNSKSHYINNNQYFPFKADIIRDVKSSREFKKTFSSNLKRTLGREAKEHLERKFSEDWDEIPEKKHKIKSSIALTNINKIINDPDKNQSNNVLAADEDQGKNFNRDFTEEDNFDIKSLSNNKINDALSRNVSNKYYKNDSLNSNFPAFEEIENKEAQNLINKKKFESNSKSNFNANNSNGIFPQNVKILTANANIKNQTYCIKNNQSNGNNLNDNSDFESNRFQNFNFNANNSLFPYKQNENTFYSYMPHEGPYSSVKINIKKTDILIDKNYLNFNKCNGYNLMKFNFLDNNNNESKEFAKRNLITNKNQDSYHNNNNLNEQKYLASPKKNIDYKNIRSGNNSSNISFSTINNINNHININNRSINLILANELSIVKNNYNKNSNNVDIPTSNLQKFYSDSVNKKLKMNSNDNISRGISNKSFLGNNSNILNINNKSKRGLTKGEIKKYFLIKKQMPLSPNNQRNTTFPIEKRNFSPVKNQINENILKNELEKRKLKLDSTINSCLKRPDFSAISGDDSKKSVADLLKISSNKHNFLSKNQSSSNKILNDINPNVYSNQHNRNKNNKDKKLKSIFNPQPNFLPVSSEAFKKIFINNERILPVFSQELKRETKHIFSKSVTNLYKIKKEKREIKMYLNINNDKNFNNNAEKNNFDNEINIRQGYGIEKDFFRQKLNEYQNEIINSVIKNKNESPTKGILEKKIKNEFILDQIKIDNPFMIKLSK